MLLSFNPLLMHAHVCWGDGSPHVEPTNKHKPLVALQNVGPSLSYSCYCLFFSNSSPATSPSNQSGNREPVSVSNKPRRYSSLLTTSLSFVSQPLKFVPAPFCVRYGRSRGEVVRSPLTLPLGPDLCPVSSGHPFWSAVSSGCLLLVLPWEQRMWMESGGWALNLL